MDLLERAVPSLDTYPPGILRKIETKGKKSNIYS